MLGVQQTVSSSSEIKNVAFSQLERRELNIGQTMPRLSKILIMSFQPGGTARKIGWGVRPASQNCYPIYDQNLRYSLPDL